MKFGFSKNVFMMFLLLTDICTGKILAYSSEPLDVADDQSFVCSSLSKIPEEKRNILSILFSHFVFDKCFAYTLFGSKPMSTTAVYKPSRASVLILYQNYSNCYLDSLWNTWEKYKEIFPMNNFVFLTQEKGDFFEIYFINKKNCLMVIEENLSLFQNEMGFKKTSQEILDSLYNSEDIFCDALKKSQILYGILFGYGRENAAGFYNLHCHPNRHIIKHSERIDHDWLSTPFCALELPRFASFSEEEGTRLIRKYDAERKEILDVYSKGDFLEITLKKLSEK